MCEAEQRWWVPRELFADDAGSGAGGALLLLVHGWRYNRR